MLRAVCVVSRPAAPPQERARRMRPCGTRTSSDASASGGDNVEEEEATSMIDLYDNATNRKIGSILESELKVLVDYLEEESPDDQDYFIDQATIDYMADGRASDHLVNLLRAAVGSSDGVEIRWERR
ncbi:MAG TPA: hypothetical protein VMS64_29650 [Candidatus Methylomirabilis sp.]|nr:hypothetical protein [Candidatus Methylomirabilis sp.]